ncbi:MAG: TonB-dependent receptor [Acidobacteria bacterium]|nr:TonB-dependent receptor [Acidobacteriota bacterium]
MNRSLTSSAIAAVSVLLVGTAAWAQLSTAQISGRVTDESGAVLPGVTVTATQPGTGFTRTVVTGGTGTYVLSNLPTGPYRLEVLLEGFRTYEQTGIVLQVAAAPVINVVLAVGGLEETVSVEAVPPLVDVQSAGISDMVDNERIVELPLQGRQVTDLILLAGGAVETEPPNSRSMQGTRRISVAGGLPFGVAYLLDGAMHNDPQNNSSMPLPFPDALQEFRVATSGLSAEHGMHSGASVNAVTKSGTNRFSGNAFEFLRDRRFNATHPFAAIGPDGARVDDGLKRNQFGGTLGGPIVRDRLFFFEAYQGTVVRQTPSSNIGYVPTPAMMTGDFTAIASAACNGGRAVTLRAPFVNNRIDPALFSPAAVNLARRLPATTDPCGEVRFGMSDDSNARQTVSRVDYRWTGNHSLFGRYIHTFVTEEPAYAGSDDILATANPGLDNKARSLAIGQTDVVGSNTVHSFRFAFNRTSIRRYNEPYFDPYDLGARLYSYVPDQMVVTVSNGFNISAGPATRASFGTDSYQVGDDLTLVRGSHQLSLGASVAYWKYEQESSSRAGGVWRFNGRVTGMGLADFLLGRLQNVEHGGLNQLRMNQTYIGLYAQDAWRATSRVTVNAGLRWEPFFGQNVTNGAISNFSLDDFRRGIKSTVFLNAPAGLIYPGDPGFPPGRTGLNKQWWNFSPRVGVAWDVMGNGRLAIRSSYGVAYDFPNGEYHNINSNAPPFGNRSRVEDPPGRMDDPYGHLGGDPHPITTGPNAPYVAFGAFGAMDPDINSPRVQSWNVTVERQIGSDWGAAVSYLGSYSDRLWGLVQINPGVFRGFEPCTIAGRVYNPCTQNGNLNPRRVLFEQNPAEAQFIGPVDIHTDVGSQNYRGLKLSLQRRAASGLNLNANYTWSRCFGHLTPASFAQISSGYTNPADPDFDRGYCEQDRTHVATVTAGASTPQFAGAVLGALASNWRASGILSVRSGGRLNVTTAEDIAATGIEGQRVNQISGNPYGAKSLTNYLDRAAFAVPAPGTLGNYVLNGLEGPGFWNVDLALSKLVRFAATQSVEARVEVFNLFNTFNWGNPSTDFTSGNFGRITSMTGDPRILQFGVKYGF